MKLSTVLALAPLCKAWVTKMPWFDQYEEITDIYMMPNGKKQRLPLRLHSHELVLTGSADIEQVRASFVDEYYTPVSVGGKAAVQIWMNNFTDTDCGNPDTINPYLETWTSTWVTPKDQPLDLPYNSSIGDMSYVVADPRALIWIHRVILGDAPGVNTSKNDPALGALLGGHNVWGFPKHPTKAKIQVEYSAAGDRVDFHAKHLGKPLPFSRDKVFVDALRVSVALPEKDAHNVAIPTDVKTAPDAVVGGPLWMYQQVRFGEAFNTTQNIAPWNPVTDRFELGTDEYYSSVLKMWKFQPKLKMHTDDFQIAAFKPINWMPPGPLAAKTSDILV